MTTASDRAVVLTTNERDALAIYEATSGALVFSLTNGERIDRNMFPYLEEFEQIFLWFPSRHLEYAKEWGYALNGSRCYLIRNIERPIELVRNGKHNEVKYILSREAVRVREKGFRSLTDIREEVKADLINSSTRQLGFAQWRRYSLLNKYLLGLRPGELTVITGGTGSGKTTFLCEYTLDLFTQGVRTIFCSFEMPEEKILKWMLVQYAGVPLYRVEYSNAIDMWLDKFERTKGPLTIMKTDEFREKSINQIASAIRTQVIEMACQHVVIDNLQFLVSQTTMNDDQSSSQDRFHLQDRFVGHMRNLATQYGVHVTMVVHPVKTDSDVEKLCVRVKGDADLDILHLGGSCSVTQEADNVLTIQRRRDDRDRGKIRKFLHISKNRYGGRKVEIDQLEMVFQPATYSHTMIDHSVKN
nr:Twinkle protein [Haemonchus contortus]